VLPENEEDADFRKTDIAEFDSAGIGQTAEQKLTPLVHNGQEYVPNISHVFRQDQHMVSTV